ncbi:TetR/AcrR family transcriptional regulator [Rubellicoccus peritrichatus]|uniref:TetR/AcrR family transcriptional regulator n=1 Tax=Rubellicoccus peritrichatus TaxID=3080537 RepID=A0AAQ3QSQ6_9BACT|nr:TetR/AcrR family transcriptional regulator [Puniceicoccus sp. CR14]WOO42788.1 TetR/AcrR family transcriptional regulator [Puniceicoccus sp. CR14]
MKSKILKTAEEMIRNGGYNAFSFRDIAAAVGIKSASVHYHFATKEALVCAVVEHYSEDFFTFLSKQAATATDAHSKLDAYCKSFLLAYTSTGKSCLCGILSNEVCSLPDSVRACLNQFVEANMDWLMNALSELPNIESRRTKARLFYTALEGAIATSVLTNDAVWVESVSAQLLKDLKNG